MSGLRLLFVDDDDALVMLITRKMQQLGYAPIAETNAAAALKRIRTSPFDLDALVCDLCLPGMSGFTLAQAVLELRPDLPVILTSGVISSEDQLNAQRLRILALLRKPDTVEELATNLDQLFIASQTNAATRE